VSTGLFSYYCEPERRRPLVCSLSCRLFGGVLLAALSLGASLTANAQAPFTRIYGPQDQGIVVPQYVAPTGSQAAGAQLVIRSFLQAVGVTNWNGMQATGTITYGATGNSDPATLTVIPDNQVRLDVTTSDGTRSMRIDGDAGEVQEPSGTRRALPPLEARAGLLAFPWLLASPLANPHVTVLDDGLISVSGESFHRITIERTPSSVASPTQDESLVMDLYFSPTSDLLMKSAVYVKTSNSDQERYLQVDTYANYQNFGGLLLPLTCSQTLNGQAAWTLQFTSIEPPPSTDPAFFHF
jgi:hypothetical protein